jgi:hypothetical protein
LTVPQRRLNVLFIYTFTNYNHQRFGKGW